MRGQYIRQILYHYILDRGAKRADRVVIMVGQGLKTSRASQLVETGRQTGDVNYRRGLTERGCCNVTSLYSDSTASSVTSANHSLVWYHSAIHVPGDVM